MCSALVGVKCYRGAGVHSTAELPSLCGDIRVGGEKKKAVKHEIKFPPELWEAMQWKRTFALSQPVKSLKRL